MTCLAGDFAFPGYPGLAETLVRRGTGGAAAAWAPTGLSVNDHAVRLAERFYTAAFGERRGAGRGRRPRRAAGLRARPGPRLDAAGLRPARRPGAAAALRRRSRGWGATDLATLAAALLAEGQGGAHRRARREHGSLHPRRREVLIEPLRSSPRAGEVVLVRGPGGALALHRVVRCTPRGIVTRGDATAVEDEPVAPEDVLGRAAAVSRQAAPAPARRFRPARPARPRPAPLAPRRGSAAPARARRPEPCGKMIRA